MIHELYHDNVFFLPPQFPLLMVSLGIGIAFGIIAAVNRALRYHFPKKHFVFSLCDCFEVLSAYSFLFSASLSLNAGVIRWFDVVAFLSGSCLAYYVMKKPTAFLIECLLRFTRYAFSILAVPVRFVFSVVGKVTLVLRHGMNGVHTAIRMEVYKRMRLHDAARGFAAARHE